MIWPVVLMRLQSRWGGPCVIPRWLLVLLVGFMRGSIQPAAAADTNAPVAISLTDQWENPARLQAPLDRVTILTVADRAGAEQIDAWVAALKAEFGTNLQFFAVADVSAVPGPLRGVVRRRFARQYTRPVGLDWQGAVAGQFAVKPKVANLFVLDQAGVQRHMIQGGVNGGALRELVDAVRRIGGVGQPARPRATPAQADVAR